jgi:tRNASer (uridine44-2'-O)-methyltransferase
LNSREPGISRLQSRKKGRHNRGRLYSCSEPCLATLDWIILLNTALPMAFLPQEYPTGSEPVLNDDSGIPWAPLYTHGCSFPPEIFREVMINLIRNPNINSNHLFRADILLEVPHQSDTVYNPLPKIIEIETFDLETVIIRRLIPRNVLVDKPLDQTCLIYSASNESETKSLVIYLPHISSPSESPFYHPAVHGIAFLHIFNHESKEGSISLHYAFFESGPNTPALQRTALHLLSTVHKHGQGQLNGYVKRVHHDTILPQATVQNTYAKLKTKYARSIISTWVEVTDPTKHVFEDLGIAAFLIELWAEMYPKGTEFPGFVDIGCGNGLLVHILIEEGYKGWGFDARKRKSWETHSAKAQENLSELVLVPRIVCKDKDTSEKRTESMTGTHPGTFPKGTFIISNHADELTPWTPILGNMSESPFVMIPCCSHSLSGARYRAPPPKEAGASKSAYASLVAWVLKLAEDCGWEVEKEMLRIPSTRNTALLGRRRKCDFKDVNIESLLEKYGGAEGWEENAMKLVKIGPRGH